MILKVVSPLEQNMYELHKYYITLYRSDHLLSPLTLDLLDHLLIMYNTQGGITIGDALSVFYISYFGLKFVLR
jgi:hypothetical protein